MKNKIIILFAFSAMLLTSCSVTHLGDNSATLTTSASANFKAEVTVGEKISGEGNCTYLFGFIPMQMKTYSVSGVLTGNSGGGGLNPVSMIMDLLPPTDIAKDEAAYNAVKNNNCDVIVDPVYEMVTTNMILFKTQKCIVTGYKGTINGFVQQ